ncbi:unnamed protein product [Prunus armeniaca]
MDERTRKQLNGYPAGRAGVSRQGKGQQLDRPADMSQASASPTQRGGQPDNHRNEDREERRSAVHYQRSIQERLGPQGGQPDNPHNEDHEERRSAAHSRRGGSRRQATGNLSQAQSTNTPPRQNRREGRPSQTNEEVNQRRQRDRPEMCVKDIEKLVNDRFRDLKTGRNFKDILRKEIDQAESTPFTAEIEQATPSKRFSTPSFTHFKGDSDPESHLKHFKSVMILHKADDALMCKVFVMTLREATQDWFHTLPSGSISSFKELTYVFTKEYTSCQTRRTLTICTTCTRRCDDRIASSAFKKSLPAEHDMYRELTITPSQTLAEEDQPTKRVGQRSDGFSNKNKDKGRSHQQGDAKAGDDYTKFTILIHQIFAQVKDKPWVKRSPPLKGDPDKRDTSKYCAFHGTHGHTTNNCFTWKAHFEKLVRERHCMEFIAKQAIQRTENRDIANEPPRRS